jgi:glycosyltransferase involved in cell wall biosynthesis
MNLPLVSIGFPVHNGEPFMRRALDSLIQQNYRNIEINIVENGSTDNTFAISKEYEGKYDFVHLYRNEEKLKQTRNFVKALQCGTGKYLMLTAADDFWQPDFVYLLVKELEEHPKAGVAFCAIKRINDNGEDYDELHFRGKNNPNAKTSLATLRKVLTPDVKYSLYLYGLFRNEIFKEALNYYPHDIVGHDRLFIAQMALITPFRYIDKLLYIRTQNIIGFDKRYPDEPFSIKLTKRFRQPNLLFNLIKMIASSGAVVTKQKLYLPWIAVIFLWESNLFLLRTTPFRLSRYFINLSKKYLPEHIYLELKYIKKLILNDR